MTRAEILKKRADLYRIRDDFSKQVWALEVLAAQLLAEAFPTSREQVQHLSREREAGKKLAS